MAATQIGPSRMTVTIPDGAWARGGLTDLSVLLRIGPEGKVDHVSLARLSLTPAAVDEIARIIRRIERGHGPAGE